MAKKYRVTVAGETYEVVVEDLGLEGAPVAHSGEQIHRAAPAPAAHAAPAPVPLPAASVPAAAKSPDGAGRVISPLPGKIIAVKVQPGHKVKRGDLLLIIEAMKMENEVFAGEAGTVRQVHVSAGQNVETGALLVELTPGG
jgi:glutaconyl-CoA decarboxylase